MQFIYRSVNSFNVKAGEEIVRLPIPAFNQKYLKDATLTRENDCLLIKLRSVGSPKENQIIPLLIGGNTVGYVIPGAALCSNDHEFAENPMFGSFATIAIYKILQSINFEIASIPTSLDDVISEEHFYCIANKKFCKVRSEDEFLNSFFPDLMLNGLFDGKNIDHKFALQLSEIPSDLRSIKLKKANSGAPFVRKAFFSLIPFEKDPFFAFFYAWQVVEFFMLKEFEAKLSAFIKRHEEEKSIVNFRKALDRVNEFSKEKNRIRAVFVDPKLDTLLHEDIEDVYSLISTQLETKKNGNSALEDEATENDVDVPALMLYYIRNTMFHSFEKIESHKDPMGKLIKSLSLYLIKKCS
jgi:hypothetical protein